MIHAITKEFFGRTFFCHSRAISPDAKELNRFTEGNLPIAHFLLNYLRRLRVTGEQVQYESSSVA